MASSSRIGPPHSVPPIRKNCTYAQGSQVRGDWPIVRIPRMVGVRFSTRSIKRQAANLCSYVRLLSARTSGAKALGRYSLSNKARLNSSNGVDGRGHTSNGKSRDLRFSFRIRSSCAVAKPRLGPIRTQIRPRYRTGGASAGITATTAISAPFRIRFSTVSVGGGTIFPSARTAPSCVSNSSVIGRPEGWPLSLTPTKRIPCSLWLGRSLANAQIVWHPLSAASLDHDCFRSTRSDSRSSKSMVSSSSDRGRGCIDQIVS